MSDSLAGVRKFFLGLFGLNDTGDHKPPLDPVCSTGVYLEEMTRKVAIPALKSVAWQCEAVSLLTKPIVVITAGALIFGLGITLASSFAGVVVNVIAIALAGIGAGLVGLGIKDGANGVLDAVSQQCSTVAKRARDLKERVLHNVT